MMYTLNELFQHYGPGARNYICADKYACVMTNGDNSMSVNHLQHSVEAYSFTLVRRGSLVIRSGEQTLSFFTNDVYVYLPGFSFYIVSVSSDYEGVCLIVDELTTHEATVFREMLKRSYFPFIQVGGPKLSLDATEAARMERLLLSIRDYILHPLPSSEAIVASLYSAFILHFTDVIGNLPQYPSVSGRKADLFVSFYTLLRKHFIEHRDIRFYANELHITSIYLSRIVKEISGRTVMACVDTMLVSEATWLLQASQLSVAQIADRLHFASPSSFDKFFVRMRGRHPGAYRKRNGSMGKAEDKSS